MDCPFCGGVEGEAARPRLIRHFTRLARRGASAKRAGEKRDAGFGTITKVGNGDGKTAKRRAETAVARERAVVMAAMPKRREEGAGLTAGKADKDVHKDLGKRSAGRDFPFDS
jgi:hypothetical protein